MIQDIAIAVLIAVAIDVAVAGVLVLQWQCNGIIYLKCYAHPAGPSVPRFFVSLCLGLLLA